MSICNAPGRRRALRATTALVPILSALGLAPTAAWSQSPTELPTIVVRDRAPSTAAPPTEAQSPAPAPAEGLVSPLAATTLDRRDLAPAVASTSDTATLLTAAPGVAVYQAGGLSGLPVVNGMADDRVRVLVGGMPITSACANHMNPVLSYIDPAMVAKVKVEAGVTPVSAGGDSIAGTINVDPAAPQFAGPGEMLRKSATVSTFYRSVNHGIGGSAEATIATRDLSLTYQGAWVRAGNYRAGNGATVKSTFYETQNHAVTLAARNLGNLFVLTVGGQFIPYQGFVNQRMDMVENRSLFANGRWEGEFDWGRLDARVYAQHTRHGMDFIRPDKTGNMPMDTEGVEAGYAVKAEIRHSARDLFRIGNELQHTTLDDWWPPVGTGGMSPNTFWNINGGRRTRLGTYAEWEAKWTSQWSTLVGVRNDTVWMNTGPVQGYNTTMVNYLAESTAFNAADRARTDVNFDATALVRYEADRNATYELGYARKTRSPNLYERYAWSSGMMAMRMNGWFGDGNGYIGNLDLAPEVAHTLSATASWHDAARKRWEIKITPYYSYVRDFIDVDRCVIAGTTSCTAANATATTGFVNLRFTNHDARIWGVNVSGKLEAWNSLEHGRGVVSGTLGWVRGENLDTGGGLYHMMPLNAKIGLDHTLGGWSSGIDVQMVAAKTDVQAVRNELTTPAYALVNLRAGYQWTDVRLDVGVDNLFDRHYFLPLGGADLVTNGKVYGYAVPGPGRSINTRLTVKF